MITLLWNRFDSPRIDLYYLEDEHEELVAACAGHYANGYYANVSNIDEDFGKLESLLNGRAVAKGVKCFDAQGPVYIAGFIPQFAGRLSFRESNKIR